MKGSSAELQKLSLVAFVNDVYLFSKCVDSMNESYYENKSFKLIFKALKEFYVKYTKIPNQLELKIKASELYLDIYGDKDNIALEIDSIYSTERSSEDFYTETVIEFIRRHNLEDAVGEVVKSLDGGSIDLDATAVRFSKALDINVRRNRILTLSDTSKLREARQEVLGSQDSPMMVKFFIDSVNKCMQYKAIPPCTLNMVVAPPGRGKTTLLINQGLYAAQQGFKTLHIFLGDMSRYDGIIRYTACLSGTPSNNLVDLTEEELESFMRKWNMSGIMNNIDIASYAADEVSALQLIEEIKNAQRENKCHYNQIIIDYDENLRYDDTENIYMSGGSVYNSIALFATLNRSVIFIAAQPKPQFWDREVIPLEGASESSKKQKIIDLMITMGKPGKSSSIATMYLAKNRRGQDSKIMRLKISGDTARISQITDDEYNMIKNREKNSGNSE